MAEIVKKRSLEDRESALENPAIIESEVFDASRKARNILQEARNQAHAIVQEAEAKSQKTLQDAYSKGFADGQQKGMAKYEEAIVHLNREYDEILKNAEEQLVGLSLGIAQKIIKSELKTNPVVIVDIVRQAIAPMNRKRGITLRVNPQDKKILEEHRSQILESLIQGGNIFFIPDEKISRGGCVIETEHGTVDSRLETQLGMLSRLLTGQACSFQFLHEPEHEEAERSHVSPPARMSLPHTMKKISLNPTSSSPQPHDFDVEQKGAAAIVEPEAPYEFDLEEKKIPQQSSHSFAEEGISQDQDQDQDNDPEYQENVGEFEDENAFTSEDSQELQPGLTPQEKQGFVEQMNELAKTFKEGKGIEDILSSLDEIIDDDQDSEDQE